MTATLPTSMLDAETAYGKFCEQNASDESAPEVRTAVLARQASTGLTVEQSKVWHAGVFVADWQLEEYPVPERFSIVNRDGWTGWTVPLYDLKHSPVGLYMQIVTPGANPSRCYSTGLDHAAFGLEHDSLIMLVRSMTAGIVGGAHGIRTVCCQHARLSEQLLQRLTDLSASIVVVVSFDDDEADEKALNTWGEQLKTTDLPVYSLLVPVPKGGLAEWCKNVGPERFTETLHSTALTPSSGQTPFTNMADLVTMEPDIRHLHLEHYAPPPKPTSDPDATEAFERIVLADEGWAEEEADNDRIAMLAGAELLDELRRTVTRYVALPSSEAEVAVTLWIAATHAQQSWQHATRLVIRSPEKRCGKSRLLDVIEGTCHNPILTANASVPAMYRLIDEADPPTILLDEADVIFGKDKGNEGSQDLRGMLNAGFGRGRPYYRCVGPKNEVQPFSSFAMAALAAIGDLIPDTITDRGVVLLMNRRAPGQLVAPFNSRRDQPRLHRVRDRLAEWVREHLAELEDAEPELPVEDRASDCWEPLVALADLAGGEWPRLARAAVLHFATAAVEEAQEESIGIKLLSDVRSVFKKEGKSEIASEVMVARLREIPESPWDQFDLTTNKLAHRLRNYRVKPSQVRPDGPGGKQVRGYHLEHFQDAFQRYLPPEKEPTA